MSTFSREHIHDNLFVLVKTQLDKKNSSINRKKIPRHAQLQMFGLKDMNKQGQTAKELYTMKEA